MRIKNQVTMNHLVDLEGFHLTVINDCMCYIYIYIYIYITSMMRIVEEEEQIIN